MTGPGPNPQRLGACPRCGAYRSDGRPPYLHRPGCPHEDDPQAGRWIAGHQAGGDHGGPPVDRHVEVSCAEHGPMDRDDTMCRWTCPRRCGTWLPDEEAVRLIGASPPAPGPLQIAVT